VRTEAGASGCSADLPTLYRDSVMPVTLARVRSPERSSAAALAKVMPHTLAMDMCGVAPLPTLARLN
jgi:hypothetical protein